MRRCYESPEEGGPEKEAEGKWPPDGHEIPVLTGYPDTLKMPPDWQGKA